MKKNLPQRFVAKKLFLTLIGLIVLFSSYATTYSSTGAGGLWSASASWSPAAPAGGPTTGDIVTIISGSPISVAAAATCATITINSGGQLFLTGGNLTVSTTFTINGTLDCGAFIVNGACNFTFNSGTSDTLKIGSSAGITTTGTASGSIQNTGGTRSFGANSTYEYKSANTGVVQVTGNGLPTTIRNLTINRSASADTVALSNNITLATSSGGGFLTLNKGIFNVSSAQTLTFNGSGGGINNPNVTGTSNFAVSGTNGSNEGTITCTTSGGGSFIIAGPGLTTFYNLTTNQTSPTLQITSANSVLINGGLNIAPGNVSGFFAQSSLTNSPIYGAASSLTIDVTSNSYAPGKEWAATSGFTIGTTAGYPNNVQIQNLANGGTVSIANNLNINGILTIGDVAGSKPAKSTQFFASAANFSCSGLVINTASQFEGSTGTITIKGSWTRLGTATYTTNSGTVNFAGGTCSSPSTISAPVSETFFKLSITNGAYVSLSSPVTVTNTFTLLTVAPGGILTTSGTSPLSITNTAVGGITGGYSGAFINGPVKWTLLTSGTNNYTFPLGVATCPSTNSYLPLTLSSKNTTASNIATAQAFTGAPSGGTGLASGAAQYWSLSTSLGLGTTGSSVSLTQTTAVAAGSVIGKSTSVGGAYTSIGGTVSGNSVNTSNDIATTSPWFFVIGTVVSSTVAIANGTQSTGSPTINSTKNVIYSFTASPTVADATLTGFNFTTTGSIISADITQYQLWYNPSVNTFTDAGTVAIGSVSGIGNATATPFGSFVTKVITNGTTGYFWITADITSAAIAGHTVTVSALNSGGSNFTIAGATYTAGTITAGGLQTITATAPTVVTGLATSITTTTTTLNGTVNANLLTSVTANFDWGTSTTPYNNLAQTPTTGANPTGNTPTATTLNVTGLVPNTLYHFRTNGVYASATTNGNDATFITVPNAPTGITANTATTSGFIVNWTAPVGIGAGYTYTLTVSTSNTFASGNTTVNSIAAGTTTHTFTTLSPGTTYYYEVQVVSTLAGSQVSALDQSTVENNPTSITTLFNTIVGGTACTTGTGSSGAPAVIVDGTPASYTDAIWANAPANPINQTTTGSGAVSGSTWQAMFDATNLYVLINLNDGTNNSSCSQAGNSFNYDGVDVLLNGDNSHNTFGGGISGQNTYNRSCSGSNGAPTAGGGTESNSTYSTVVNGTSAYTEYITIPWANVPAMQHLTSSQITALSTIGFDVDYNDDQTGTTRANQQAWFTNSSTLFNTPSVWGYAKLSVCAPPTLSVPAVSNITATGATLQDTVKTLNGGGSLLTSTLGNNAAGIQYSVNSGLTGPAFATLVGTPGINPIPYSVSSGALSPQTKYYCQGYVTRTNFSTNVIGTSPIDSFHTLSSVPTAQPSSLTASTVSCSQITLSWPTSSFPAAGVATKTGYIVLRTVSGTPPTVTGIVNRYPSTGFSLPGGTSIVDIVTVSNGSLPATNTFNDPVVSFGTTYSYLVIPFTWNGSAADSTYNYLTTGTLATATATAGSSMVWLGNNTNWNDVSNWCSGTMPTSSTNVIIPKGLTTYPILSGVNYADTIFLGTTGTGAAASITIGSGGSLSIYGAITNGGGSINASNGTVVMAGAAAQTIGGSMFTSATIQNLSDSNTNASGLIINNSSADSIYVTGQLNFPFATATLVTNGLLSLVSNATNTASVGQSGSATISGNVIVQRYFPGHRRWRLVTAPVTAASAQTINADWQEGAVSVTGVSNPNPVPGFGTHISGPRSGAYQSGLGYDQTPTNSASIATVHDTASWFSIPNTISTKVTDHQGYMLFVRGARDYNIGSSTQYTTATNATLRTTGNLNTGTQTIPVVAGPNVIGNPYASAINFNGIFNRAANNAVLGTSIANNTFYLWDPNIASAANFASGTGGWVVLTSDGSGGYTPVPDPRSISPFDVTGAIQSGAGFIIHAQNAGTIQIGESDKVSGSTNNDTYLFRPTAPDVMLRTTLYATDADTITYVADGVLNMFNTGYSNDVDWSKDIQKQANVSEGCSIIKNGRLIAVERSLPVNAGDTIFLQMAHLAQRTYRFVLEATSFNRPDLAAFLIDTFTHITTPVALGDSSTNIDFTVTGTSGAAAANRFAITFRLAPGSVTYNSVTATQQNKNVLVQWTVSNQLNIKEYIVEASTDGIHFHPVDTTLATQGNPGIITYSWLDVNPVTGINYYRIQNIDNAGASQESETVNVTIGKGIISGIAIYPNPVVNETINLQMNNVPTGNYEINVIDETGQAVLNEEINHGTFSETKYISLNKSLSKGVYILEVQYPDNTITKIKFVNQ